MGGYRIWIGRRAFGLYKCYARRIPACTVFSMVYFMSGVGDNFHFNDRSGNGRDAGQSPVFAAGEKVGGIHMEGLLGRTI
jgi:hypothetical protein